MRLNITNRLKQHTITIYNLKEEKNDTDIFLPSIRDEEILLKDYPCEIENLNVSFRQHEEAYSADLRSGKKVFLTYDVKNPIIFSNGMKVKINSCFDEYMGTIQGYKWYYNINLLYIIVNIDSLPSN